MRYALALVASAFIAVTACASAGAQTQPAAPPQQAAAYRGPDIAAQRAAIDRLSALVGNWQGQANVTAPHAMIVHQTERVERDLDGLVLVIHGTGYANAEHSGAPVFQALGVISYDDRRGIYEARTYANGFTTTAEAQFLDDGSFRWSINAGGPVRIRYTITFDQNSWNEIGEMSRDSGETWSRTIEMNLSRVE